MSPVVPSGPKTVAVKGKRSPFLLAVLLSVTAIIFLTVYLPAKIGTADVVGKTAFLMGTIIEIKVSLPKGGDRRDVELKIEKAMGEIRRVESLFSTYIEGSEVSKINRLKAGERLKIDEEVFGLIGKASVFSEATGGAFDITVKPLVDLWAKAKESGNIPSDAEVRAAREKIGWADIALDKASGTISFAKSDGFKERYGASEPEIR